MSTTNRYLEYLKSFLCDRGDYEPDTFLYHQLCDILFQTEFRWTIRNDENRARDGVNMRDRFLDEGELNTSAEFAVFNRWAEQTPCSVLEMMIALADRIENEITYSWDRPYQAERWILLMFENLGIDAADDWHWEEGTDEMVHDRLDIWMDRKFNRSGSGGLWPLRDPPKDQRRSEIWYQMSAYFVENKIC